MMRGYRIGKLFGIEIAIDLSWIIIFFLVTLNLAVGVFPRLQPQWGTGLHWTMGVVASLVFFASVLAHELAHSLVAQARGLPVHRITLFLFGGVSNLSQEPKSPATEFLIAIVGPVTSIVLGLLSILVVGQTVDNASLAFTNPDQFIASLSPIQTLLLWLGPVNIVVGVFNMIPGFPLDGGRVLRSFLWGITNNLKLATRIASSIGQLVGFVMIAIGVSMALGVNVPLLGGGVASGIWMAFIGWFLSNAASQSYEQLVMQSTLEMIRVQQLMRKELVLVRPDISVSQLIDQHMLGTDWRVFPVMYEDALQGLVAIEDVQKIPRQQWDETPVRDVMTPLRELEIVDPQDKVNEALAKISQRDLGQLPVMKNGRLIGLLFLRDILLCVEISCAPKGVN